MAAVRPLLNDYTILHFATHAAFVTGAPEDSFILFGNGDTPTLRDIEAWSLSNVDLVVLSACETGVGGLGNGEEILGLGYQFQLSGAQAVMASLWQVNDQATQILMATFYAALNQGHSKAEALRQAQTALITGDFALLAGSDRGLTVLAADGLPTAPASTRAVATLEHPYFWAAFILIGNGQ